MSNFPTDFDDDVSLPFVNDDITEVGAEAINAQRDAIFNIEQEIGIGASGTAGSIASRIGVSLDPDGSIKTSAIASLGLVTLPITNSQIINNAEIPESKLKLDHRTQDLFNYISDLAGDVNTALGWITTTGIKLDPHLNGVIYRHILAHIDVASSPSQYLRNKFNTLRDNTNSYTMLSDLNSELLNHHWADGSPASDVQDITTLDGSTFPSNYAHTASGIFINTSRFAAIPQTTQDLQQLADFIDSTSLFLIGSRVQNLYSNGISRASRSSSLTADGYGQSIIPSTPAIAYLLNTGSSSNPFDDINFGDDIVELQPPQAQLDNNSFDSKFALVKVGDIIRINYGSVEVQYIIKEKKYIQNGGNKRFVVRINGKNLTYAPNATARIDKPLFNTNKYGVLAVAPANNNFSELPSLIIGSPRGAQALGIGFNADTFDQTHYNLYLALYPNGNPSDGYIGLPAIDVTGNQGVTPGAYTLEGIVKTTNEALRAAGYNYRFIAFSYQGEFGIMLADSYNNVSFSVISAIVDSSGTYDQTATENAYPNNVVGIFPDSTAPDPLGFSPYSSGVASPPLLQSYGSAEAASIPTRIFVPLKRNTYYVNGTEKEKLSLDVDQSLDDFGDGFWTATVQNKQIFPGPSPTGRVQTTYRVPLDLSASQLKVGKTLVVQPVGQSGVVDFGRFIIQDIVFSVCEPDIYTDITVYDAVHAFGSSPTTTLAVGSTVALYFNSDSVAFNEENASDFSNVSPFKRLFEVYIDQNANTFTHERGRFNISGGNISVNGNTLVGATEIAKLDLLSISPKLRGYQFGSVNKIRLNLSLDSTTGVFSGLLSSEGGLQTGPLTSGKIGEITRFYDETCVDFIDIIFPVDVNISTFSLASLDIQLFPTLSLDEEVMLMATCQVNDTTKVVNYLQDARQFGNVSEEQLSNSAINFINSGEKFLHVSGVIRGFDLVSNNSNNMYIKGGLAVVNGKFIAVNNSHITIPAFYEVYSAEAFNINWAVCVSDVGELVCIPLTDYDPDVPTPENAEDRRMEVFNPNTAQTYDIESLTFTHLIENRKDLALLYVVTALDGEDGDPPTLLTLEIKDARRFTNDGDSNFPITWTSDTVQGNFRDLESIKIWIKFNKTFNNLVRLRGSFSYTQSVDLSGFTSKVEFIGEGAEISTTAPKGFLLGSNLVLKNINFTYAPTGTYTNSVNSDNGCLYAALTSSTGDISNIRIEQCTFTEDVGGLVRPPFISFEIDRNVTLKNVNICDNTFTDASTEPPGHCAIVLSHTLSGSGSVSGGAENVFIERNIADHQMIFMSTDTNVDSELSGFGLSAYNCHIKDNFCDVISVINSLAPNTTTNPLKPNLLTVSGNRCRLIAPLDTSVGAFPVLSTAPSYGLGNLLIENNSAHWIHVLGQDRAASGHFADVKIIANSLTSSNNAYLDDFEDDGATTDRAIWIATGYGTTNETNSFLISENIINTGRNSDGTSRRYAVAGIQCESSAIITNNVIRGLGTDSAGISIAPGDGSAVPVRHHVIQGNKIYRGSISIGAYILVDTSAATDSGLCIDNFFDSTTIDGSSQVLITVQPAGWVIERNKNSANTFVVRGYMGTTTIAPNGSGFHLASGETVLSPLSYVSVAQSPTSTLQFAYLDLNVDTVMRWYIPLASILPPNVTIQSVMVDATGTNLAATQRKATLTLSSYTDSDTDTVDPLTASSTTLELEEGSDFAVGNYINTSISALAVEFEFRCNHSVAFTPTLAEMYIVYRW